MTSSAGKRKIQLTFRVIWIDLCGYHCLHQGRVSDSLHLRTAL